MTTSEVAEVHQFLLRLYRSHPLLDRRPDEYSDSLTGDMGSP